MQFEKFDNKIREAAEHHHPAYDDKAWDKMEKLLDEHLPQKKKRRRRFLFILFLFLLLGVGGWYVVGKTGNSGSKVESLDQKSLNQNLNKRIKPNTYESKGNKTVNQVNKEFAIDKINEKKIEDEIQSKSSVKVEAVAKTELKNGSRIDRQRPSDGNIKKQFVSTQGSQQVFRKEKKAMINESGMDQVKNKKDDQKITNGSVKQEMNELNPDMENKKESFTTKETGLEIANESKTNKKIVEDPIKNLTQEKTINPDINISNKSSVEEQPKQDTIANKNSQDKPVKSIKRRGQLFFTLSTGPDFSFVGSEGPGKVKWVGGIGLGFTIKERFTLRTGFYSARKIYSANPSDYNAPGYFYNYYPNLQKIDADCKVYEIPLLLSYSFEKSAKQNWFASTGLSSYLMEKETYNYFYKYTPSSATVNKKWTVPDKNSHLFSVLHLSAGYQRKIGKKFSLMIEPYMKIPVSGVGFGKVKLNSGGVLLSFGVYPFTPSLKNNR